MSLPRFYIPPSSWDLANLVLTGDEARHCAQVMRRQVGDEIVVFNGGGARARASITAIGKERVELKLEDSGETPPPVVGLSLLLAIPKGANMDLIIEKAVELGVNEILPVFSERTVVKLDARDSAKKREKWERIALEACKQCGQNWLPKVHVPLPFDAVWSTLPSHDLRFVAAIQEDAVPFKTALADARAQVYPPASALMVIGPEGDLTPAEYALARSQGCVPITLGAIILRVETAAMYCLSVLTHELR